MTADTPEPQGTAAAPGADTPGTAPASLTGEELAAAIGPWATAAEAYALTTVDVPAEHWIEALTAARDVLGLTYFDWLSAVDELAEGFSVAAHLAAVGEAHGAVRRVLLRTRVPREAAELPTATGVYHGAAWHERETHEMFGIGFTGHPELTTLLLPDGFEGHPLRKEFVLAARVAKAWPGAKEPGESDSDHAGPARRRMLPPGVPDPNEWGPLAGTLPPAPERPARGAARGPAADRPRRARSAAAGSVTQTSAGTPAPGAPEAGTPQARTAGPPQAGAAPGVDRPRRARTAAEGPATQAAPPESSAAPAAPADAPAARRPARTSDAPWQNVGGEPPAAPQPAPQPEREAQPEPEREAQPEPQPETQPEPQREPESEAAAPLADRPAATPDGGARPAAGDDPAEGGDDR